MRGVNLYHGAVVLLQFAVVLYFVVPTIFLKSAYFIDQQLKIIDGY